MNFDFIIMNGNGVYVWSSFVLVFLVCFLLFIKTRKTLKKLEKDFIKETQYLSNEEVGYIKNQKIIKEILFSHSKS